MSDTALKLADRLDLWGDQGDLLEASAELRRLHAEHTELGQAIKRAIERINELEAELHEQARVNGMGGEREARLIALNAELVEALQGMIDCCPETRGTHNPHLAMARAALAKMEASK